LLGSEALFSSNGHVDANVKLINSFVSKNQKEINLTYHDLQGTTGLCMAMFRHS